MVTISIEHYAMFRSLAGKTSEQFITPAETPAEIYDILRTKYRFPLEKSVVHVAINDEHAGWDTRLRSGDRLVFIPPVSGG